MKLPDIKEIGKDMVQVTVKTAFEPQTKDFPPKNGKPGYTSTSMGAYVTCDGKEYNVYFKEKYFPIVKSGAKLMGVKKEYMNTPYYEWYADNSGHVVGENAPNPGEADYNPAPPAYINQPNPPKDNMQERIIKGMVFNNACTLLSAKGDLNCDTVLELSKELHSKMYDWLKS